MYSLSNRNRRKFQKHWLNFRLYSRQVIDQPMNMDIHTSRIMAAMELDEKEPLQGALADMFYGDYYGLLTRLKVSPYMHWIVTRLNGLTDSMDYNSDSLMIYIPLESELDRLKILFLSTNA